MCLVWLLAFLLVIAFGKGKKIVREENFSIKIQKAPQSKHFQNFWVYKREHCSWSRAVSQNLLNALKFSIKCQPLTILFQKQIIDVRDILPNEDKVPVAPTDLHLFSWNPIKKKVISELKGNHCKRQKLVNQNIIYREFEKNVETLLQTINI